MQRLILLIAVAVLAGCGGTGAHEAASTPPTPPTGSAYPDDPQVVARATTAAQRADLVRLWNDTLGVRRAAAASRGHSLKGDKRVRAATGRFIDDLDASKIDDLSKNRAIDHAAAAVAPVCEQCFQQLEAIRPIPAIAH